MDPTPKLTRAVDRRPHDHLHHHHQHRVRYVPPPDRRFYVRRYPHTHAQRSKEPSVADCYCCCYVGTNHHLVPLAGRHPPSTHTCILRNQEEWAKKNNSMLEKLKPSRWKGRYARLFKKKTHAREFEGAKIEEYFLRRFLLQKTAENKRCYTRPSRWKMQQQQQPKRMKARLWGTKHVGRCRCCTWDHTPGKKIK